MFAAIESSNIVGYQSLPTANFMYIGPSFQQVNIDPANTKLTWSDIKVNCDETGEGWQALSDSINILDENGTFVNTAIYLPGYLASELEVAEGWYSGNCALTEDFSDPKDCLNSTIINFGTAVQIHADPGKAKVTFAGQVKAAPTVTDCANFMGVANCTPLTITIKDFVVNCDETGNNVEKGWQALSDSINILDENGTYVHTIIYLPTYLAEELGVAKGWYHGDCALNEDFSNPADCFNDMEVKAGAGIQIHADPGTATISVKSALAK